jgi:hypothetical protein
MWPLNDMAGKIDVKMSVSIKPTAMKNLFKVSGYVVGDRFPANETYLTDKNGNILFLGVS